MLCTGFQNDLFSAVSDLRSVNRLQQDSTDGYFRLAELLYRMGHVGDALKVADAFFLAHQIFENVCDLLTLHFQLLFIQK